MFTPDIGHLDPKQTPERVDAWLKLLRFGASLLFWTFLSYYPFLILLGFTALALGGGLWPLGGGRPPGWMDWLVYIPRLARVAVVLGLWLLTVRVPGEASFGPSEILRRGVRAFAVLEALTWVMHFVHATTGVILFSMPGAGASLVVLLISAAYTAMCLLYFADLAERVGWEPVARSFRFLLIGYLVMKAHELPSLLPPLHWLTYSWWFPVVKFLPFCVFIWGLVLMRRFEKRLHLSAEGRCSDCGYLLKGLPAPRCPECGRTFVVPIMR